MNIPFAISARTAHLIGLENFANSEGAIVELVKNAYDADAKNVWITVDTEKNTLTVEDDGKGMTASDINNSFLNIGYEITPPI